LKSFFFQILLALLFCEKSPQKNGSEIILSEYLMIRSLFFTSVIFINEGRKLSRKKRKNRNYRGRSAAAGTVGRKSVLLSFPFPFFP
jgi:hypothetical protein